VFCHCVLTFISGLRGVNSDDSGCIGELRPDQLGGDLLQCASPPELAVTDASFGAAIVTMIMLFVGEYFNRTKGDADRPWESSRALVITEAAVQVLLTVQVFYSVLRLRTKADALYICLVLLDLAWIFSLMLTRQWREVSQVRKMDWLPVFVLEVWDVVNSFIVTVSLAQDDTRNWPTGIVDGFLVLTCLTLFLFQATYPHWTSLRRIAMLSCFSDIVTDGPMLYLTISNELWDDNAVRSIAAFVNVCLISVGVFIWPLKNYIQQLHPPEAVPPVPPVPPVPDPVLPIYLPLPPPQPIQLPHIHAHVVPALFVPDPPLGQGHWEYMGDDGTWQAYDSTANTKLEQEVIHHLDFIVTIFIIHSTLLQCYVA
jgi:hypothetical protein